MKNPMNKVYNYLGLAKRAGQVVSGEQAVLGAVQRNKVRLLLISTDASQNTQDKFSSLALNHSVPFHIYGEKDLFGQAIGSSPRAVVGILDRSFANVIQTQVQESVQEKI